MVVQEYILHLTNGDNIVATEPYEMEGSKTIVNRFVASRKNPDMMLRVGDPVIGMSYIPWSNVVYIETGNVVETNSQQDMIWKIYGVNQMKNDDGKKRKHTGDKTNVGEK